MNDCSEFSNGFEECLLKALRRLSQAPLKGKGFSKALRRLFRGLVNGLGFSKGIVNAL